MEYPFIPDLNPRKKLPLQARRPPRSRTLRIKKPRKPEAEARPPRVFRPCEIEFTVLESGETVKRGCGSRGLVRFEAGWRCFYCGNYIYHPRLQLAVLWRHFKTAREFWRATHINGQNYINGIPVSGNVESLPAYLLADLLEVEPPEWFGFYLLYEEAEFARYLENPRRFSRKSNPSTQSVHGNENNGRRKRISI